MTTENETQRTHWVNYARGMVASVFEVTYPQFRDAMSGAATVQLNNTLTPLYVALEDETVLAMFVFKLNGVSRLTFGVSALPLQVVAQAPGVCRLELSDDQLSAPSAAWLLTRYFLRAMPLADIPHVANLDNMLQHWRVLLSMFDKGDQVMGNEVDFEQAAYAIQQMLPDFPAEELSNALRTGAVNAEAA